MLVEHRVPKLEIIHFNQAQQAHGIVVVIDVLRAFTTAAYAFASGAEKIILTTDIEEAKALAQTLPQALTLGEENGLPIPGFDFDNSPWSFNGYDLTGKTLIQSTSSGFQGVAKCQHCDKILAASFVVAEATLSRLATLNSTKLTFVLTGSLDGSEDEALAEYFQARINGSLEGTIAPYLRKVAQSPAGQQAKQHHGDYPLSDLDAALAIDAFPFAMEVIRENNLIALKPVRTGGSIWPS